MQLPAADVAAGCDSCGRARSFGKKGDEVPVQMQSDISVEAVAIHAPSDVLLVRRHDRVVLALGPFLWRHRC